MVAISSKRRCVKEVLALYVKHGQELLISINAHFPVLHVFTTNQIF